MEGKCYWVFSAKSAIEVATLAFKQLTLPNIGIFAIRSQFDFTNREIPKPSLPTTKQSGTFFGASFNVKSLSPSSPTTQNPFSLSFLIVEERLVTSAHFTKLIAPVETFATVSFSETEPFFL